MTTAAPPQGQAGSIGYGPNVNATAVLLGTDGNVPVEATADLMAALVGAPVSTGFVVKAAQRLSARLEAAGFEAAMKAALRAEPVLGADQSPVNVVSPQIDPETSGEACVSTIDATFASAATGGWVRRLSQTGWPCPGSPTPSTCRDGTR